MLCHALACQCDVRGDQQHLSTFAVVPAEHAVPVTTLAATASGRSLVGLVFEGTSILLHASNKRE